MFWPGGLPCALLGRVLSNDPVVSKCGGIWAARCRIDGVLFRRLPEIGRLMGGMHLGIHMGRRCPHWQLCLRLPLQLLELLLLVQLLVPCRPAVSWVGYLTLLERCWVLVEKLTLCNLGLHP